MYTQFNTATIAWDHVFISFLSVCFVRTSASKMVQNSAYIMIFVSFNQSRPTPRDEKHLIRFLRRAGPEFDNCPTPRTK